MVVTLRARVQFIGGLSGRDLYGASCSSNKVYVINLQSCLLDSSWVYSFLEYLCVYKCNCKQCYVTVIYIYIYIYIYMTWPV